MTWLEAAGLGCSGTCFLIFAVITVVERYFKSEPNFRASYAYAAATALAATQFVWWIGQVVA